MTTTLDQVEPLLYISNHKGRSAELLSGANIRLVIACGLPSERAVYAPITDASIRIHDYMFDDHEKVDIIPHVRETHALITDAHSRGEAVLVHCFAGISRSAALVMGHLMLKHGIPRLEAFVQVENMRECIHPNAGFFRQLGVLE